LNNYKEERWLHEEQSSEFSFGLSDFEFCLLAFFASISLLSSWVVRIAVLDLRKFFNYSIHRYISWMEVFYIKSFSL
jgi:hypothetical protein